MLSLFRSDAFLISKVCAEPFMNIWFRRVPRITIRLRAALHWDGSQVLWPLPFLNARPQGAITSQHYSLAL